MDKTTKEKGEGKMWFRKLKSIKDIYDLEVYDNNIYISKTFIYQFMEMNSSLDVNICENCFFNHHREVGCIEAPCGFKGERKDKRIGYFKLIGDLRGGIVESLDLQIDVLTKKNKSLQNDIKQLCTHGDTTFQANKKVYLSGPITALIEAGKEDEAREMFEKAEKHLKLFGFEVVNPFNNGVDKNEPWVKHILVDLNMLDPCQAICYLHTWDLMASPGGEMEKIVARRAKKIEIRETLVDGKYTYTILK